MVVVRLKMSYYILSLLALSVISSLLHSPISATTHQARAKLGKNLELLLKLDKLLLGLLEMVQLCKQSS